MKPIEALAQEYERNANMDCHECGQSDSEKAFIAGYEAGAKAASGWDSEALKIATAFVKSCIIDSEGSCYEHTGDVSSEAYDVLAKLKALSGAGKGEGHE